MIAPPRPPRDEIEALIKEARARQIRRRAAGAAALAIAAAVAFTTYSLVGGTNLRSTSSSPPASRAISATSGCARGRPRLLLSRTAGPVGTAVAITSCGCRHPLGQADRLGWQDHYYWTRTAEKKWQYDVWRVLPLIRTSRTTARSTFVVRRTDHPGRGLLDMWCGGASSGNAMGYFDVTR